MELLQQLRFNRERLSTMSTAIKSKWLFVGTEKGNTHVLNLDHFSLSGYIINWNKAIGVHQSSHPGPVSYLLGEMRLRIFESSVFPAGLVFCLCPHILRDECKKSCSVSISQKEREAPNFICGIANIVILQRV